MPVNSRCTATKIIGQRKASRLSEKRVDLPQQKESATSRASSEEHLPK